MQVKFTIDKTFMRSGDEAITTDIDRSDRKICVFLSVLMLSLFITNSGDIVSELIGGGMQQSNISNALKVLCGLVFVYCLPEILKHITKAKLAIIFASALVILLNILFFNSSQLKDTSIVFYTMCLTGFMASDSLRNFSLLKLYFVKVSRLIAVMGMLILILDFTGIIISLRTSVYQMGLGYACMIPILFLLWNFAEKRTAVDLAGSIALLILTVLYGSRGPVVGIILFAVYYGIRYFHKIGKDVIWVLMLFAMFALAIFYKDIGSVLYNVLEGMGITSRTINLIAEGDLNHDSGRIMIWDTLIAEIQTNPFKIRGINAEYTVIGMYAHNIIIELIYQHGIIIGSVSLVYIFVKIIDTLRLDIKENASVICLIFMFASIPSLNFSGSLWTDYKFWVWLAMIININRNKKTIRVKDKLC